jgi:hypothetical protein
MQEGGMARYGECGVWVLGVSDHVGDCRAVNIEINSLDVTKVWSGR